MCPPWAVMFHPEELLEDMLAELCGDAGPAIRHGKMQDGLVS